MNVSLQKWYKHIIPLLIIACLLSVHATASPDCPIIAARFNGLSEGTTVNNSSTGWYLDASHVSPTAIFWVKSNRFHAQELGGEGVWYSKVFSVAGYTDFQIATKITAEGDMNNSEYVKVYYKINGGPEILLDQRTGNFGTVDFVSPLLNGNNVQFVIRIYNYNNGGSQTSKYYIEDYRVFKEHGPCAGGITVSASASNNGTLTCTNASVTLSASSSASGVSYSWTGPGGFSSTAQNPVVTLAGNYNVIATNSSGTGSASITITENKALPAVTATGASLGCAASVTISASSPVSNAQYAWAGPGFSSALQNPVVSTAGTYTVTVTNPANGCAASRQVEVTGGSFAASAFWLEDFTQPNGTTADTGPTAWTLENIAAGTFSVQNNELMAAFSAANEGVWKSGVIDIASKSNVVFSLHLRSGSAGSSDYFEDDDYIRVAYKLDNGAEIPIFNDISGLKDSNTGTAYDTVTSPALNGNNLQIIVRLRNSNTTERYYLDNVKLTGYDTVNAPLRAAVSGPLTCAADSVTLLGSSTIPNLSFSWTGPGGFTASTQNAVATAPGVYTLTGTNGSCSATAAVTVVREYLPPANLSITYLSDTDTLNCNVNHVIIAASSTTPGTQYSWTGPNNFTINGTSIITVFNPGVYTATALHPVSGCTDSVSYTVHVNRVFPGASVTPNLAMLSCRDSSIVITAGADASTVNYSWTGPDSIAATGPTITAMVPGNYYLLVTDTVNGCTTSTTATILENKTVPASLAITTPAGSLTCINNQVTLTGSSTTDYVNYSWTGPEGFQAPTSIIRTSVPGDYVMTATHQVSGCTATTGITVTRDITPPAGVSAFSTDQLTCITTAVNINGASGTPGVTFSWTTPDGGTINGQSALVSVPGPYQLKVTNPVNGCFSNAIATVVANNTAPDITVSNTGPLTCDVFFVEIQGSSNTPDVDYSWAGPDGFQSTSPVELAFSPGEYTLTVLNLSNGCVSTATTTVEEDYSACQVGLAKTTTVQPAQPVQSVQPIASTQLTAAAIQVEYRAYPNPARGRMYVEFRIPEKALVNAGIYNTTGACKKVLFNSPAQPGRLYQIPVDTGTFAEGVYYCVIRVNGRPYSIKMLSLKK